MTKALIHSESSKGKPVFGVIGTLRWECEWQELTSAAQRRRQADPDDYEHDRDRDEITRTTAHASKEEAIARGQVEAPSSAYGVAIVQEHRLEWFVQKDNVAEWEPVGPQFEVDAQGSVAEV